MCQACVGHTLILHDEIASYVQVTRCPYMADYQQERYILAWFRHYQNGHLVQPIAEWPQWINQGVTYLSLFESNDQKKKDAALN